ncbi:MAG: hypothetical protein IPK66_18730 [Rhodospirillales bacterium]|nr:hypothetical protein [Rhodospirillales bacterium]
MITRIKIPENSRNVNDSRSHFGSKSHDGHDLAGDQRVEQHADGGQVLLDRRLRHRLLQALDVSGDVQRLTANMRELALILPPAVISITPGYATGERAIGFRTHGPISRTVSCYT